MLPARPEPSVPGRLLAALLSQNTLVQPEVALTRATQFLLALPDASSALDPLVAAAGLSPEPGGFWVTEARSDEGGRSDLECHWGSPAAAQVIVEAKIGHLLDAEQLAGYRSRLGRDGLLVVLVPVTRRRAGQHVVDDLREQYARTGDPVRVALWTWDEVANALEAALPAQHPDAAQLRGLIDTAGALDLAPFRESELATSDRSRFDDLWKVLDRASFTSAALPSRSNVDFERQRYFPVGDTGAHFLVGLGRRGRTADAEPQPWCWVMIPADTRWGRAQQATIHTLRPDAEQDGNRLFVPLDLEPGLSGYELTESLRQQLDDLAHHLRDGIVQARQDHAHVEDIDEQLLTPLLGMPAFTAGELLDSDPTRRADLEAILQQAMWHLRDKPRWFNNDSAFARRSWLKVEPYLSHLSVGLGRRDTATSPQPWAWLSVHDATHQAETVHQALDTAFPGHVVRIVDGWGLPLDITAGQSGVEAFRTVVDHVETASRRVRTALQTRSAGP